MKKQIMKRAWEIYRTLVGDKVAKLSYALKKAWAEAKESVIGEIMNGWNITKLEKAGAVRWTKYGKDRMYIKKFGNKLMNLVIAWRRTGSIESAKLDGEEISNGEANRIMITYQNAYIDLVSGKVYGVSENAYGDNFTSKLYSTFGA